MERTKIPIWSKSRAKKYPLKTDSFLYIRIYQEPLQIKSCLCSEWLLDKETNLWLWPRKKKLVRTALAIFSALCSGPGHWGAFMTYKSSGICPCTRLESFHSLSRFSIWQRDLQFVQNLITKFQVNFLVNMYDFFPPTNATIHVQFCTFTQGSCPTSLSAEPRQSLQR